MTRRGCRPVRASEIQSSPSQCPRLSLLLLSLQVKPQTGSSSGPLSVSTSTNALAGIRSGHWSTSDYPVSFSQKLCRAICLGRQISVQVLLLSSLEFEEYLCIRQQFEEIRVLIADAQATDKGASPPCYPSDHRKSSVVFHTKFRFQEGYSPLLTDSYTGQLYTPGLTSCRPTHPASVQKRAS